MKGGNSEMYAQNYMERSVKLRDFRDISLPAENINNIRKPRDLILKTANLDNTLNLDNMVLTQKYLVPRMFKSISSAKDILSPRGDK